PGDGFRPVRQQGRDVRPGDFRGRHHARPGGRRFRPADLIGRRQGSPENPVLRRYLKPRLVLKSRGDDWVPTGTVGQEVAWVELTPATDWFPVWKCPSVRLYCDRRKNVR